MPKTVTTPSNGLLPRPVQPPQDQSEVSYTYNPLDPVPILWSRTLYSEPGNRRRLDYRQDILRYRSAPLIESREIAGEATVLLFVSCTTPDTDLFARITIHHGPETPSHLVLPTLV